MAIAFIAPNLVDGEIENNIEVIDVAQELEFWENDIILFALGETLTMNAVRKFMEKTWNFVALPNLYYNEDVYFIVRFKC